MVLAITYNAVPFTLLAWAEQHISSALAAVLNASTPLFAAVLTAVLLGERLSRAQLAGLLLGFVGVAVAAGVGGDDFTGIVALGRAGGRRRLRVLRLRLHLRPTAPRRASLPSSPPAGSCWPRR